MEDHHVAVGQSPPVNPHVTNVTGPIAIAPFVISLQVVRLVLTSRPLPHICAALDSSLRPASIHLDNPDPSSTASMDADAVASPHGSLQQKDVQRALQHGLGRMGLGTEEPGKQKSAAHGQSGGGQGRREGEQQQGELLRVLVDKAGGNMACAMRWVSAGFVLLAIAPVQPRDAAGLQRSDPALRVLQRMGRFCLLPC